jgi:hypothetical protein
MKYSIPRFVGLVCWLSLAIAEAVPPPAATAEWNALLASCGPLTTVAGNAVTGALDPDNNDWIPSFENDSALSANLSNPHMAQADALGNIYIADKASDSVLKVTPDGKIHTWAGTHVDGFNGDGPALATTLQLSQPNGIFVVPDGTVFVYDPGNQRIRKISPSGQMTTIIHDTDPRWATSGRGLWVNQAQTVIYYTMEVVNLSTGNKIGGVVKKWSSTTGTVHAITRYPASPTSSTLEFQNPGNIDVNPADGKLYVTDRAEDDNTPARSKVWRIDTEGVNGSISTKTAVAGSGVSTIPGGDGALATATFLDEVRGISFLSNGSYFLVTHQGGDIWYVDTYGYIHLFIQGRGGKDLVLGEGSTLPITTYEAISEPRSVVIMPNGSILIVSNDSGVVRKIPRTVSVPPASVVDTLWATPTNWRLRWNSQVGQTYLVERSLDLQTWTVQQIVTAASTLSTYQETVPAGQSRAFWKLSPPK